MSALTKDEAKALIDQYLLAVADYGFPGMYESDETVTYSYENDQFFIVVKITHNSEVRTNLSVSEMREFIEEKRASRPIH